MGSQNSLTLASYGLCPGVHWGQCRAGLPLASARTGAFWRARTFIELPEAGTTAAFLLAIGLDQDIVVAAVVTEDTATYPAERTSAGSEDDALWGSCQRLSTRPGLHAEH